MVAHEYGHQPYLTVRYVPDQTATLAKFASIAARCRHAGAAIALIRIDRNLLQRPSVKRAACIWHTEKEQRAKAWPRRCTGVAGSVIIPPAPQRRGGQARAVSGRGQAGVCSRLRWSPAGIVACPAVQQSGGRTHGLFGGFCGILGGWNEPATAARATMPDGQR